MAEVYEFLARRVEAAEKAGIGRERIALDPGIGFGKTFEHNLELLRNLGRFATLGCVLLIGTSRKGMLGTLTGRAVDQRLTASVVSSLFAAELGASVVRVHDVGAMADAVKVWGALRGGTLPSYDELQGVENPRTPREDTLPNGAEMKSIHKYSLDTTREDKITVMMPRVAKIVMVGSQNGNPFLWAIVDTESPLFARHFRLIATGQPDPRRSSSILRVSPGTTASPPGTFSSSLAPRSRRAGTAHHVTASAVRR